LQYRHCPVQISFFDFRKSLATFLGFSPDSTDLISLA
jgi:hypothetical protein